MEPSLTQSLEKRTLGIFSDTLIGGSDDDKTSLCLLPSFLRGTALCASERVLCHLEKSNFHF